MTPERKYMHALLRVMGWLRWSRYAAIACIAINAIGGALAVYAGTVSWPFAAMAVGGLILYVFVADMEERAQVKWLQLCPCPTCTAFRQKHGLDK